MASISTPVRAVADASQVATTERVDSTSSNATRTWSSASGWQRGRSSGVRFAASMPATSACASTSPFGFFPSRSAANAAPLISIRPCAIARRRVGDFSPTSIIRKRSAMAHLVELHVEEVHEQRPARERRGAPEQHLRGLRDLQARHHRRRERRVPELRLDALPARARGAEERREVSARELQRDLPVPAGDRPVDQGDLELGAGRRELPANEDAVEAVEDDRAAAEQLTPVRAREGDPVRDDLDRRVHRRDALLRDLHLCAPELGGGREELPVQVVLLEDVGIDDDQGAHAEPGELLDEVAAEAAAADHGDAAPAQAELIGGGDRRAIAPVAARQEVPAERRHLDLAEALAEVPRRVALGAPRKEVALGARLQELVERGRRHAHPPPSSGKIAIVSPDAVTCSSAAWRPPSSSTPISSRAIPRPSTSPPIVVPGGHSRSAVSNRPSRNIANSLMVTCIAAPASQLLRRALPFVPRRRDAPGAMSGPPPPIGLFRSEEHTSELQSHHDIV